MKEISQLNNADEIITLTNSWEERGKRKGREEGLEEGLEQGLEQGLEKGLEQGKKEVALALIREGAPIDLIAKVTHLTKDEIKRMREELHE